MQFWQVRQENPVSKYLKYSKGQFLYRDKDAKENKEFFLQEFIVLKTGYTVKWWSDHYEVGVRSNEVEYLTEWLKVSTFKDKKGRTHEIASWIYKEFKGDLENWINLHKCLTILQDNEIVHLSLKGNAMRVIWEFLKVIDISKIKIKYLESKFLKKGKVEYFSPVFGMGSEITPEEYDIAISKLWLINEVQKNKQEEEKDTFVDDFLAEVKPDEATQEAIDQNLLPF